MYSKIIWLLAGLLSFVIAPLKVTSVFTPLEFVDSTWFLSLILVLVAAIYITAQFFKTEIENLQVRRNIPLGILSLLISAAFLFCVSSYDGTAGAYDFEWQPVVMSFLSIFSAVTFLLMAVTHFTGKNIHAKVPVFLFCPVLWFAFNMICFLSIQNENSDIYDIGLTAFLALFFLYYSQVYSTVEGSKHSIIKLMISLGLSTFSLMLMKCIPLGIKYFGNYTSPKSANEFATFLMESVAGVYALGVAIEAFKQISEAKSENK